MALHCLTLIHTKAISEQGIQNTNTCYNATQFHNKSQQKSRAKIIIHAQLKICVNLLKLQQQTT